jgi:hypothetical protein
MRRTLVILGAILVVVGVAWPWLSHLGLGRLPGDVIIDRDGFRFYFPFTTSILISALLTLLFWLLRR